MSKYSIGKKRVVKIKTKKDKFFLKLSKEILFLKYTFPSIDFFYFFIVFTFKYYLNKKLICLEK